MDKPEVLAAHDKVLLIAIHECWPHTPTIGSLHQACELMDLSWEPGILKNLIDLGLVNLGQEQGPLTPINITAKGRLVAGLHLGLKAVFKF